MRRFVLSGLGILLSGTAALAASLDGRWGLSLEACNDQEGVEIVTIDTNAGTIAYYETICRIENLSAIGEFGLAWNAVQSCSGEGESWTVKAVLGIFEAYDGTPDRLAMINLTDGFATVHFRCQ